MGFLEMISLATALGTDSFSVSVGIGTQRIRRRLIFKLSTVFSFANTVMLLIGLYCGHALDYVLERYFGLQQGHVQDVACTMGGIILTLLGLHMISNCLRGEDEQINVMEQTRGLNLLMMSLGVSFDALAAGLGFGMMDMHILLTSAAVFVIGFLMAYLGLNLGSKIGYMVGRKAEILGGLMLILLGLRTFF